MDCLSKRHLWIAMILLVVIGLFLFRDPIAMRFHFWQTTRILESHGQADAEATSLSSHVGFFVKGAGSTKRFLERKAQSTDPKTVITSYVVLTSIARSITQLLQQNPHNNDAVVLQELLGDLMLDQHLQNARSMQETDLPQNWKDWLSVSQAAMRKIVVPRDPRGVTSRQ